MHFSLVHKLQQRGHVLGGRGLENHAHGAGGQRRCLEQVGKVLRTGRQYQLVGFENRSYKQKKDANYCKTLASCNLFKQRIWENEIKTHFVSGLEFFNA